MDLFQNTCFTENNNMTVEKISKDKLLEKYCLPVITWNKKHSPKQVGSITYTLDKNVFSADTFEGLSVVLVWTD